jgi:hypothetical protein
LALVAVGCSGERNLSAKEAVSALREAGARQITVTSTKDYDDFWIVASRHFGLRIRTAIHRENVIAHGGSTGQMLLVRHISVQDAKAAVRQATNGGRRICNVVVFSARKPEHNSGYRRVVSRLLAKCRSA